MTESAPCFSGKSNQGIVAAITQTE